MSTAAIIPAIAASHPAASPSHAAAQHQPAQVHTQDKTTPQRPAQHQTGQVQSAQQTAAKQQPAKQEPPAKKQAPPMKQQQPPKQQQPAKKQEPAKKQPPAKKQQPPHKPAKQHAKPAKNYQIYDSVTPAAIPGNPTVATYSNGRYAVPRSQVGKRRPVLWIDVNGQNTSAAALDVEPGDATPALAADWAKRKLSADPHGVAILYTMRSEWSATEAAVAALPGGMRSRVRWWIADPTGVNHVVPGSDATQWYWGSNYDISTATSKFQG